MLREIEQAAEVAGYLWKNGWAERNGGNLTINITNTLDPATKEHPAIAGPFQIGITLPNLKGCFFYCKGTNRRMRDLARDPMAAGSIIRICDDCSSYEIIAEQPVMPTSELPSHLMIQDFLTGRGLEHKATLHTHPIELVAMSHTEKFLDSAYLSDLLWSMIPETLAFAPLGIGIVPYGLPGSVSLAKATLEQVKEHNVVLWEKHGTLSVGKDIIEAFDETDVLNKAAKIYTTARSMGFEPEGMTAEEMLEIRETFNLPSKR